ncbi:MAG: motif family protein [Acidobacteriota bacterium]|nr:motif family protein [Acidobacteriota bacterium]
MTRRLFLTAMLAGLFALLVSSGFAQTPSAPQGQNQTQPPFGRRMGKGKGGRHGDKNPMREEHEERRALRDLNLSDAQRQQLRDIEKRYAQTFRADREEMRKLMEARRSGTTLTPEQETRARQLREELRANAERMRGEIQNILTPEQRQQLQQHRDEMKQRGDEFKHRRHDKTTPPANGNANNGQ